MKIVICASIDFTPKIVEVSDALTALGHDVVIPMGSQDIIDGKITLEEFKNEKESVSTENAERKIKNDVIKEYYKKIENSDAILVINLEKKEIPGYIGGNTLLEIGFAHVLDKPIYLYNPIPDMHYANEIAATQPTIINGDLSKITD